MRVVYNGQTGATVGVYEYAAFGEVLYSKLVGTAQTDFIYTGQEWDADLGLMNYKARLYDPQTRRFLSPDPMNQYASPYTYVGNNPVSFIDPTGMTSIPKDNSNVRMEPFGYTLNATNRYPGDYTGGAGGTDYRGYQGQIVKWVLNYEGDTWTPGGLEMAEQNYDMKYVYFKILIAYWYTTESFKEASTIVHNQNSGFAFGTDLDLSKLVLVSLYHVFPGTLSEIGGVGGNPSGQGVFDDIPLNPAVGMGEKIAGIANGYVGSTDYNLLNKKGDFLPGNPKCNKFVYDVLLQAGASPGLPNQPGRWGMPGPKPPIAAQWANANYNIPGWVVVSSPMLGDVTSFSGHLGIVSGNGLTISATLYGGVVRNDWGFRTGQTPVFRRFVGYSPYH